MSVDFKVEGFTDLYETMDKLSDEIGKGKTDRIWRNALRYAMEPVLQDAKTYAPKDTHELENHIYLKVHRPQSRDKSSKSYAGEMYMARVTLSPKREDSIQNFVMNKRGKLQPVWTNMKPVGVSQEFGNANTPMHPFMRPAMDNNTDRVINRLGWAVWEAIAKMEYKKGN